MTSDPQTVNVLDEVRRALGHSSTQEVDAPEPLPPFLDKVFELDEAELAARFVTELNALGAQVHRIVERDADHELTRIIAELCWSKSITEVALSGSAFLTDLGLENQLANSGLSVHSAEGLHDELVRRLATIGAGVTGVDYAIAETGTLVLSSDAGNALLTSLLPPVHIAIVQVGQISAALDEVISKLAVERLGRDEPTRSVSFITGPSRTSDVELTLSIGVHGPKELHVIIIDNQPAIEAT